MKNLKKLSRVEMKSLNGGRKQPDDKPCGCVMGACSTNGGNGDAYCGGGCC